MGKTLYVVSVIGNMINLLRYYKRRSKTNRGLQKKKLIR